MKVMHPQPPGLIPGLFRLRRNHPVIHWAGQIPVTASRPPSEAPNAPMYFSNPRPAKVRDLDQDLLCLIAYASMRPKTLLPDMIYLFTGFTAHWQ